MKVNKSELEQLTQGAVSSSLLAAVLLALNGCDESTLYEHLETTAKRADEVRKGLGMEALSPIGFIDGTFRKLAIEMSKVVGSDRMRKAVEGMGIKMPKVGNC